MTKLSMSHIFNLSPGTRRSGQHQEGTRGFEWRLTQNRLFESLLARGYALRVFQTDHLELCITPGAVECDTYSVTDLGVLQDSPLSTTDRAWVIASTFLGTSELYALPELPISDSAWTDATRHPDARLDLGAQRVGPLSAMTVSRRVENELRRAAPGHAIVAHLVIPHSPYLFDERCRLKPVAAWSTQRRLEPVESGEHARRTPALRGIRGPGAVRLRNARRDCWTRFPVRARQGTIVVHGDHGSRIVRNDPEAPRAHSDARPTCSMTTPPCSRSAARASAGRHATTSCP